MCGHGRKGADSMKNRIKIIVKTSDNDLLDVVRPLVEDEGCVCREVGRCGDFLDELSSGNTGLGIVDLDGGESDCVDELKDIQRASRDVPLVVVSSDQTIVLGRKIHEVSVFYCLTKPVNKAELLQVVRAGMGDHNGVPWRFRARIRDMKWYRENIPCMDVCPVHTDSGRYVQLIAEGKLKEAYLVARSPNPLASTCGKICAAFCEDSCRRSKIDCAVTIRALKRYVT
ncbi:MAG TPA: response regulator, partial [Deltaproteobacteria bacterium]|nr:response regulator [Deltaproteobacteria bacterium]